MTDKDHLQEGTTLSRPGGWKKKEREREGTQLNNIQSEKKDITTDTI